MWMMEPDLDPPEFDGPDNMNNISLFSLKGDKSVAHRWTFQPFADHMLFKVKVATWAADYNPEVFSLKRFDVVRLNSVGREDWFGVITSLKLTKKFSWRSDYDVRVRTFENLLDAIEYSEKKRAKYVDKADTKTGQSSSL